MLPFSVQRFVATVALRWYYRSVEVVGREHVPRAGPVLFAANHNNAMVDALVAMAVLGRRVRLTAKATLLDHPLTRFVVHLAGIVPLRRRRDAASGGATPDRNDEAFAAIIAALARGSAILIFPEGISHSDTRLAPLKTGCARIALQALAQGISGLQIVPFGITFEKKGQPRSRVHVEVAPALVVDPALLDRPDAVSTLTVAIERSLLDVTLSFPSPDEAATVLELSATLAKVLDRARPLERPDAPLAATLQLARRLESVRVSLPDRAPEVVDRVAHFVDRIHALRAGVRERDVSLADIWIDSSWRAGLAFAIREFAVSLGAGPLALWGRVNHWVPLSLARLVSRATSRNPDEPAMHTMVVGFILVLLWYAGVAAMVGARWGVGWALWYLVSLPIAGSVGFWLADRWHRARRRARAFVWFQREPEAQRQLVDQAAWLRAESSRLDQLLGA